MKNIIQRFALFSSVALLFSCASSTSSSSSSTSSSSSASSSSFVLAEDTAFSKAVENLGDNYTLNYLATDDLTGKQYLAPYDVLTDTAFYQAKAGTGVMIASSDNIYLRHFAYSKNTLSVYGRSGFMSDLPGKGIRSLFETYQNEFQYMEASDGTGYYDLYYMKGVYDFFSYFSKAYYIDSYKEGTDIYVTLDKNGALSGIYLLDSSSSSHGNYMIDYYQFSAIGTSKLSFIDTFNAQGGVGTDRIQDVKDVNYTVSYQSYYQGDEVSLTGILSSHYGTTYTLEDENSLCIECAGLTGVKIGDKVTVKGTATGEKFHTYLKDCSVSATLSSGNAVTVFQDDPKKNGYGYYPADYFYAYPQFSGSVFSTCCRLSGSYSVQESTATLNFAYPEITNGNGEALSGDFIVPGALSTATKTAFYNAVNGILPNNFLLGNIICEFDVSMPFRLKFILTEEMTIERDLTLEEKVLKYLGTSISIPSFNNQSIFTDTSVWGDGGATAQDCLVIFGNIYDESATTIRDLVPPYVKTLEDTYGFTLDDHFGEWTSYEFYTLTKGISVIELACIHHETVWGEAGYWTLRITLYQSSVVHKPVSTEKFIQNIVGDDVQIPLVEGGDNYTYSTRLAFKPYGSNLTAAWLYCRSDSSELASYKTTLSNAGYALVESFLSRGRNHDVYLKDGVYVDVSEYPQDDFLHGKNYEKAYRLEILVYKNTAVITPLLKNDLSVFYQALQSDYNLSDYQNTVHKDLAPSLPSISFPTGVTVETFYTRDQVIHGSLTGGYFPNAFIYAVKGADGTYTESINAIKALLKSKLTAASYTYNEITKADNNPYFPDGVEIYNYTPSGAQYALVSYYVTVNESTGYVLMRSI